MLLARRCRSGTRTRRLVITFQLRRLVVTIQSLLCQAITEAHRRRWLHMLVVGNCRRTTRRVSTRRPSVPASAHPLRSLYPSRVTFADATLPHAGTEIGTSGRFMKRRGVTHVQFRAVRLLFPSLPTSAPTCGPSTNGGATLCATFATPPCPRGPCSLSTSGMFMTTIGHTSAPCANCASPSGATWSATPAALIRRVSLRTGGSLPMRLMGPAAAPSPTVLRCCPVRPVPVASHRLLRLLGCTERRSACAIVFCLSVEYAF